MDSAAAAPATSPSPREAPKRKCRARVSHHKWGAGRGTHGHRDAKLRKILPAEYRGLASHGVWGKSGPEHLCKWAHGHEQTGHVH